MESLITARVSHPCLLEEVWHSGSRPTKDLQGKGSEKGREEKKKEKRVEGKERERERE